MEKKGGWEESQADEWGGGGGGGLRVSKGKRKVNWAVVDGSRGWDYKL